MATNSPPQQQLLGTDRPPMVPLISRQPEFLFASDIETVRFAENHALVGQLWDSLRCWLSHIAEVEERRSELLLGYDRAELLSVVALHADMTVYEKEAAFCVHFDRPEIVACVKVLRVVRSDARIAADVRRLDEQVEMIKQRHAEAINALEYVGHLHSVLQSPTGDAAHSMTEDGVWSASDCSDALTPLFSGLRAMWVCCALFGCANGGRFAAIVRWIVRRVERSIHATGCGVIDRLIDAPRNAGRIKEALVAAQDAAVTVQEHFHDLRQQLSQNGALFGTAATSPSPAAAASALPLHTIFFDMDDDALFATVEWQFHRITEILAAVDALVADLEKLGSALTDPLSHIDIMDPDVMDAATFHKCVHRIVTESAPSAAAILERMGLKASPTKALVTKIPFEDLTTSLILNVEFNPPAVTAIGGPLSEGAMSAAMTSLPATCSNTQVMSLRKEMLPPRWHDLGPKIKRLEIQNQFCDSDVSQTFFLLTLMDIVESEDAWKMTDTHAYTDGLQELHMLHFRKHRSTKVSKQGAANRPAIGQ